ncbi:RICIN domain-containing protein [Streptomyces diastatochromogenes]|uniref:Ricin B lectin domain-containing protein n=1 Tax=Streptomyces diastatochromogenes TaxID=42236 RepID=A0A233S1S0_STRDA|nr:RICIN domain-containing protein [Streptomyces diastatochromogenes]MCZ0991543.1 RICIN domain-containing protein [Streptomyces diastatochromogenes]OXY89615.1 hypothetical protein BEK98_36955 [Streptomyces diastatochromogenes]
MGSQDPLPKQAQSVAEFTRCMRCLKEQVGLTFRQLEARAAQNGDVLARSTLADALRRNSLPRSDVLIAFLRACGYGDDAHVWLEARDRLASAQGIDPAEQQSRQAEFGPETETVAADSGTAGSTKAPGAVPRYRRQTVLLSTAAGFLLAALGAWALLPEGAGHQGAKARASESVRSPSAASASTAGVAARLPAGPSRIRPAGAPRLCVTEGHDRQGRYRSQVAVQRPCGDATPPQTSLASAGRDGAYYIQWRHPVHGLGCLTALGSDHVVTGMLEPWPWESCSADRTSQHFLFEPIDKPVVGGYRIRVAQNGLCLGINGDDDRVAGAEVTQQLCTGARDQEFLVDDID